MMFIFTCYSILNVNSLPFESDQVRREMIHHSQKRRGGEKSWKRCNFSLCHFSFRNIAIQTICVTLWKHENFTCKVLGETHQFHANVRWEAFINSRSFIFNKSYINIYKCLPHIKLSNMAIITKKMSSLKKPAPSSNEWLQFTLYLTFFFSLFFL